MPAFNSQSESSEISDSLEEVRIGMVSSLCASLFPPVCVFCGRILLKEKDDAAAFFSKKLQICRNCLAILPLRFPKERRISCLSNPYEGDPAPDMQVLVPFRYEDPIVQALQAVKFHDAPYIAITLSFFMSESLLAEASLFDAVIPIPLSSQRRKKRGYNQAELLAEPLARRMNVPYVPAFLIRTRHTRQQSRFSDPILRSANICDAFSVPDEFDLEGLSILLVDDVTTTGSTLHEAAVTLYRKGARYVAGIAAASGRI